MPNTYPNPLTPAYLLGAINKRPTSYTRQGYMGRKLLPEQAVYEYELTWDAIKAENQLAGVYTFAGKPVPGSDMLFEQMFADVVNLMAMRVIDPETVMKLREPGQPNISTSDRGAQMKAKRKYTEYVNWCDDRIEALVEYLIMSAMQGQVNWPPAQIATANWEPQFGDAIFNITYPFRTSPSFKQNATTLSGYDSRSGGGVAWNAAAADPFLDLEVIAELIAETTGLSARNSTILCSTGVLSYLTQNTKFLNRIAGTDRGIDFLNVQLIKDFIRDRIGYKFVEYDAQYTYRTNVGSTDGPTITALRFLPRGRCLILPPGEDFGFFATAPHAGPDRSYKPGKYTWVYDEPTPPFETQLGIGQIGWPVLQRADSIFVFDAWL